MDIEDKDYAEKVNEWINNLEDYKQQKIGSPVHIFNINYPPFNGLTISLHCNRQLGHTMLFERNSSLKIYYPKNIEFSYTEDNRKIMFAVKTDELWVYDENIINTLRTISFGMDMTMSFLKELNWDRNTQDWLSYYCKYYQEIIKPNRKYCTYCKIRCIHSGSKKEENYLIKDEKNRH